MIIGKQNYNNNKKKNYLKNLILGTKEAYDLIDR